MLAALGLGYIFERQTIPDVIVVSSTEMISCILDDFYMVSSSGLNVVEILEYKTTIAVTVAKYT